MLGETADARQRGSRERSGRAANAIIGRESEEKIARRNRLKVERRALAKQL